MIDIWFWAAILILLAAVIAPWPVSLLMLAFGLLFLGVFIHKAGRRK